jgi:hypothetical protein
MSVLLKICRSGKSSAFRPVKWERSYISGTFIISYFDCNVFIFHYIDIYLTFSIIFNKNLVFFHGEFLYFFKHV